MPSTVKHLDTIIIGAGSAGLAALREVRKQTERYLLINEGPYGTTCARVGCMPSKALVEAAKAYHARLRLAEFGIQGGEKLRADLPAVLRRVRALRDRFVSGVLEITSNLGERSIAGHARLLGPDRVEVDDRVYKARRIILATGSSPVVPAPWRQLGDRVLTTDSIFEQTSLPDRIGVIGLGAIGIEFAQALAHLGIEVHAFDQGPSWAGLTDARVNDALRAILESDMTVHTGNAVELSPSGTGVCIRAGTVELEVPHVLVAIGRRPNLDGLGLESLGVERDERGMPPFDPQTTRIADLPVFIAGDANGHAALLHEAADEGHMAGLNAFTGEATCFERRTPIGIIFCEPEVALVGQRFAELDAGQVAIGEVDFTSQGRASIAQRNQGLARIYAARTDARLLGAEMCAPAAEHMAHLLALAIGRDLTVHDLLGMPFYHPVLEEGLRTALRDLARQFEKKRSDLSTCPAYQVEALD